MIDDIINKLQSFNVFETGKKLLSKDLIEAQKILQKEKNISMPDDFIDFLHHYNGFSFDGGHIFGVFDNEHLLNNIVLENLKLTATGFVFLGKNEFDYIAFDGTNYVSIDKEDFEVMDEFEDFSSAFFHIINL
ncbi:MAG: hypothetical protein R3Y43_02315 [Alphaproteobacteria bacterium]